MKLNMLKSLVVPFFFLASPAKAKSSSSLAFGGDDSLPKEMKEKMLAASDQINKKLRHLASGDSHSEYMIKNLDCSACMEAYPIEIEDPNRRLGQRDLAVDEVFVTALNCDPGNPLQVWNMHALDDSGIWNLFENVETESCMQLVGECSFDGSLYTIEMGECDPTNPKAIWGVTGIGQIVNFDCFVNVFDSASTPDVFLEAKCGPSGGKDRLDISSLSSGSEDTASNYWAVFPKDLFDANEPECSECGTCDEVHGGVGCSCVGCEAIVCDIDPYCCNVEWDGICVNEAFDLCNSCTVH